MNHSNRKRQHFEQQQKEGKDNLSIDAVNSEWSSFNPEMENNTNSNDGNEWREMERKMAALESKNALLEAKVEMVENKLEKQQELNAKMHLLTEELQKVKEENKALVKKLEETEQKTQMAQNELEEIIQTSRQKLEELANEIALLREQQQKEGTTSLAQIEKELSPCLRLLPLETWADTFGFLPRPQLAEFVPQIGDRHFATKAQYYLHECGRITLGELDIRRSTSWVNRKKGIPIPIVKFYEYDPMEYKYNADQPGWEYPMADVPIPKNIINFEAIHISYFNQSLLGFLQEFHRKSLLTNLDLCLNKEDVDYNAFSQLVPLLDNIDKLDLYCIDILKFIETEYSKAMLASARILIIQYKLEDDWYSRWLCTPREDRKPRVLLLYFHIHADADADADRPIYTFIEHIKKDFMDSNWAVSFLIHLCHSGYFMNVNDVQSHSLEKSKTNERLVIKGRDKPFDPVTIARQPMHANEVWIEEMNKELNYEYRKKIRIEI